MHSWQLLILPWRFSSWRFPCMETSTWSSDSESSERANWEASATKAETRFWAGSTSDYIHVGCYSSHNGSIWLLLPFVQVLDWPMAVRWPQEKISPHPLGNGSVLARVPSAIFFASLQQQEKSSNSIDRKHAQRTNEKWICTGFKSWLFVKQR